ncbi:hypothetical protein BH10BAC5_BH10BAC5_28910 [soil metagenome]
MKLLTKRLLMCFFGIAVISVIVLSLSRNSTSTSSFSYVYEDKDYIDGEMIVSFRNDVDAYQFASKMDNIGLTAVERLVPEMNIWLMKFDKTKLPSEQALISVKSKAEVVVAQFNHKVQERNTTPNDTRFGEQWDYNNTGQTGGTPGADIKGPAAWDISTGGNTALGDTVVVCLVDGGNDLTHPDLAYWKNYQEIPGNGIDDDGNGYIDDVNGWNAINNNGVITSASHGTHVAGTMGAIGNNSQGVTGVNWKVKIMSIVGSTSSEAVAVRAYGYAFTMRKLYNQTNGLKGAFVVSTNSSFGVDNGQPSNYPLWCAFYDSLGKVGILSAGAGPNNNVNIDVVGDIPTACPSDWLIAVTNTTNTDVRNSGAGYGPINMDLGAPGTNILSTLPGNTYGLNTGTSMATPHVAGAVGLMYAAAGSNYINLARTKPDSVAKLFKKYMLSSVDTLPGLSNEVLSKGRLNLYKTLLKVKTVNVPVLNPYNLTLPAAGITITTVANSSTPVNFNWDTCASGVSYRFIFGSPSAPSRTISIPAGQNSLSMTSGQLDNMLAGLGVSQGSSLIGSWDVWAYRTLPTVDSLKATNGPRALTLTRNLPALGPFSLSAPAANFSITTNPIDLSPVNFIWTRSGTGGGTYKWLYKTGISYSDPATFRISSGSGGYDTSLVLRISQLDTMLAAAGVAPGDSITGYWKVRSYTSVDSVNSTVPDRKITFKRAGLLPLLQNFSDATMPPAFWTLSIGTAATQYWQRASFSAYGLTGGCAMYNFWTASASTGPQTLTSNQFPPVASGTNYLRFNEACGYYSATSIDSCIIETSTNAGASWTRLVGMYQSLTLSSGTNSTPVMTTVSATAQLTAPTASQWATKIFAMPVGTNMVRFIAKSAFGNNLFVDDITSGNTTGIGNSLSFTPDKYELYQNYPNPFNPTTKINFDVPRSGIISLKIYDLTGRELTQLINENMSAGRYSIDFNGANYASGVYFYRIEAPGFSMSKRMMLIK